MADIFPTHPEHPAHLANQGRKPRPITKPVFMGHPGLDQPSTTRTGAPMQNKMGHVHSDLGKLNDLMGVIRFHAAYGQMGISTTADIRHYSRDTSRFHQLLPVSFVPLLTAPFSFGLFPGCFGVFLRFIKRRVGRWRLIGISRIASKPILQALNILPD